MELANLLIDRSIIAISAGHESASKTRYLLEHPEDFGKTKNGGEPASIWQDNKLFKVAEDSDATCGALHQCPYGAVSSKPTRLMGTVRNLREILYNGWPRFTPSGFYRGPLPAACPHPSGHRPLLGFNKTKQVWNTSLSLQAIRQRCACGSPSS